MSDFARSLVSEGADADRRADDEALLQRLIAHLPTRVTHAVAWLRAPHRHVVRWLAAIGFLIGGIFSFLPVLGLWMLPLGLVLLADDVAFLRVRRGRLLHWLAAKRPNWFDPA